MRLSRLECSHGSVITGSLKASATEKGDAISTGTREFELPYVPLEEMNMADSA